MGMNKSRLALTIGILYFALALPLAEQKDFAAGMCGNLQHLIYVLFFHDQNQVGIIDDVCRQLTRLERFGVVPVGLENRARRRFHGFPDPCREAGGGHRDRCRRQRTAQQKFCRWTAAYIADADDKDLSEQGYFPV